MAIQAITPLAQLINVQKNPSAASEINVVGCTMKRAESSSRDA
jgi:hypothetical protein